MTDDRPMNRLRGANPLPDGLPAIPVDRILARIADPPDPDAAHRSRRPARSRWPSRLALGAGMAVPLCIAAVAIGLLTGRSGRQPSRPEQPVRTSVLPRAFRAEGAELGVLRRAQNARDRSLPRILARAARRGHLEGAGTEVLAGSIPRLTRYLKTLPDGREVFLVAQRDMPGAGPLTARDPSLHLVFVQPSGSWSDGQPISNPGGSADDTFLFAEDAGGLGCFDTVYYRLAPDRVKRVQYRFPRQDAAGYDYRRPLTVTVPVVNNLIATVIPNRAPCQRPSVISLYGSGGTLLGRRGNGADLDRVIRPVRRGDPLAGMRKLDRAAARSTPTHR